MSVRREDPLDSLKNEVQYLLDAAQNAIINGISDISGYKTPEDLKQDLLKVIDGHDDFNQALKALHDKHPETPSKDGE